MISTDPWIALINALEPDYQALRDMMERGPKIFANLSQRGKYWCITLQEELVSSQVFYSNLDDRAEWTANQLKEWPDVKRMAHDMWFFKRKRDAEKFQTLFNIKWPQ